MIALTCESALFIVVVLLPFEKITKSEEVE